MVRWGSSSDGRAKSGTGLPISAEGSALRSTASSCRCFLSLRVFRNKPARPRNRISGMSIQGLRTAWLSFYRLSGSTTGAQTIALVRRCQQTAQGHEDTAPPDPAYKRLDVHTDGPGPQFLIQRLAHGDKQVTGQSGVDTGLGHGHVLHGVQTLFRVQRGDLAVVAIDLDDALIGDPVRPFEVGRALEHEAV